jgi:phytoene dehydrogenase-like protein
LPADLEAFQRELIRIAPEDSPRIQNLVKLARRFAPLDPPEHPLELLSLRQKLHLLFRYAPILPLIPKWKNKGVVDYINTFQNPFLREVLASLAGDPRMSAIVLIMVIAIRCGPNAGFISGGSRGLSEAIARRYTKLGGVIHYDTSAEEITIERDRATAVRCSNGKVFPAGTVISCADGYTTLFKWLQGRYVDRQIRYAYNKAEVFPGLIQVSLGVGAEFPQAPQSLSLALKQPLRPDEKNVVDRFEVAVFGPDSEFCPAGKSVFLVRFCTEYDFWTKLKTRNLADYKKAKVHLLQDVIDALDARFPGLASHVEHTDICSPASYERWTGNWKGSYQGWLPTPGIIGRRLPRRVPGLSNFYMAGHWVEPGGGLPPAALSGRYVAQIICERDGKKFVSSAA